MNLVYDGTSEVLDGVNRILRALQNGESVSITTSGTTGTPKTITANLTHALAKKREGNPSERWLLTYSPERWAGISVVLHVVKSGCTLCLPRSLQFAALIAAANSLRPTHISLTPSMFRNLIRLDTASSLAACPIDQLTFGGEAATQSVLDLAARVWPKARISHVYASTESGDICSVSDGLEGIPSSKFASHILTSEGELIVRGHPTGDLWELRGDRFYFTGRKEEVINVGGNKVSPLTIEEFAIEQGAFFARAYAMRSPLMGFLVALEYVGGPAEQELRAVFRRKLPKYMWPAHLTKVEAITLTKAGKNQRIQ